MTAFDYASVNEQDCVVSFVCLWLNEIESWVRATKEANEVYNTVWDGKILKRSQDF